MKYIYISLKTLRSDNAFSIHNYVLQVNYCIYRNYCCSVCCWQISCILISINSTWQHACMKTCQWDTIMTKLIYKQTVAPNYNTTCIFQKLCQRNTKLYGAHSTSTLLCNGLRICVRFIRFCVVILLIWYMWWCFISIECGCANSNMHIANILIYIVIVTYLLPRFTDLYWHALINCCYLVICNFCVSTARVCRFCCVRLRCDFFAVIDVWLCSFVVRAFLATNVLSWVL